MAELIIFAIISAFAGVYTLFPKYRQVRLNFGVSSLVQYLGLIGLLIVLIAVLIGTFAADSNSFIISPEWLAIDYLRFGQIYLGTQFLAESIQVLTVLAMSSYLFYLLATPSIHVSDWSEFGSKVREFRDNQRYPQLADLLNDHYTEGHCLVQGFEK